MVDLSRPWPLRLGEKRWWQPVAGALVLLAAAFAVDRPLSLWAQSLPKPLTDALADVTPYGESGWILWPSGVLFVATALVALFVRWKLMRTMLWQFAALYAFIFVAVGLPSLVSTLAKRLIGRGRPMHFSDTGLFGVDPKWFNWVDWTYQSFPSGHATTAFALALTVGFVSERWLYPALAFAALIGLSRITEGAHYPSDVVAGAILGTLGAYAMRLLFARQGWLFLQAADGRIAMRPMSSLRRYLTLKRRGIAPKRPPDRL